MAVDVNKSTPSKAVRDLKQGNARERKGTEGNVEGIIRTSRQGMDKTIISLRGTSCGISHKVCRSAPSLVAGGTASRWMT